FTGSIHSTRKPRSGWMNWPASLSRPTAVRPTGSVISRIMKSAGGPEHCSFSIRPSRRARLPSSAGSKRCTGIMPVTGRALPPIYYDPAAVRAMAPHVDAIAANYNVDSADGWIADYFFDGLRKLSGGKPVLISEWFFAARENRTGNRNNGHLMTVATQNERGIGAAAATLNFAAIPEIVGAHWFQ